MGELTRDETSLESVRTTCKNYIHHKTKKSLFYKGKKTFCRRGIVLKRKKKHFSRIAYSGRTQVWQLYQGLASYHKPSIWWTICGLNRLHSADSLMAFLFRFTPFCTNRTFNKLDSMCGA